MFARLRRVAFSRAAYPAWAILGAGLLLTALVGLSVKRSIDANVKAQFAKTCDEIVQKIRERLATHEKMLRAGVGLFAGSKGVSRSEWRAYYEQIAVNQFPPGVLSFGVIKLIRPEELQSHISVVRAEGFQDYTVRPEGSRENFAPVVYNEPFRDGNVRSLGMDGFAEPIRRAALERSRDSGQPAITGRITLHQESATDFHAGFIMSAPIYRSGILLSTTEQRRSALIGWVTSAFRMQDWMEDILRRRASQGTSGVAVFIYDQLQPIAANALYRSGSPGAPDPNALFYIERKVDFNDHPWLVVFGRDPSAAAVSYMAALLSAGAGMAISVLLFVLVLLRSSRADPQGSQR